MLSYEKENNLGGNYEMRNIDQAITINGVEITNRLVMPPMATSKANHCKNQIGKFYDDKN